MAHIKQVRLCGFGGQGLVLAGLILGHAGVNDRRYVAGSDSYGVQARGGYALSDVVLSDVPIVYPHVIRPDILIPMSQEAYDRYIEGAAEDAVVVYDEQLVTVSARTGTTQVGIPATAAAIEDVGKKQAANIVMLGATAAVTGLVSPDALRKAIEENVPEPFLRTNLLAADVGFRMGEEQWRLLDEPINRW